MRIGKQDNAVTSISTSDEASITVRGLDLCDQIIGSWDFTSYFWLLLTGDAPNETQRFFVNATLCSLAEHGLVPSVVAARMTLAAGPEAWQGAVAAGLLGCGSVILGSADLAGQFLAATIARSAAEGLSDHEFAIAEIKALRAERKAIPGFGHPQHAGGDPRANRLLALAEEKGIVGVHVKALYAARDAMPEALGRPLPINVNGAIPAVLLDVGFPLSALKGIALLARTASLIGHLNEEQERPIGFIMGGAAADRITFEGAE